jgi:nucleoside-triphosphatase
MKIIIIGKPRTGKTTLIKELISTLKKESVFGFYTEELRKEGKRKGFILKTMAGEEKLLAHVDFGGRLRVSKYGVDLSAMKIGIKEIERGMEKRGLIIVDEIGKMELFMDEFKSVLLRVFDGGYDILATMGIIDDPFTNEIKRRKDIECLTLTRENYPSLKAHIMERMKKRGFYHQE